MTTVVNVAGFFLSVLLVRILCEFARWFASKPETFRGWLARGVLLWALGRATGLLA